MVKILALLALMTIGCGSGASCRDGYNYCMDPGGNGVDTCCPATAPVLCVNRHGCITMDSNSFFDGSCGTKYFCSSEY
ncbi:MAG: hypothetical protein ACXWLM_12825 [Myxococcales bacterium]